MRAHLRDVDLELLRLFSTVAECGGFSAAQARLNLTQSTISTRMAQLETRLGYRLCQRGRAGFRLTDQGQRVLSASRKLFESLESFRAEVQEVDGQLLGELRLGLADNLAGNPAARVDQALAGICERAPQASLHLVVDAPGELARQVLDNELHLAVSYAARRLATLDYQPLFSEPQAVYCGREHALFGRSASRRELIGYDWVDAVYGAGNSDKGAPLGPVRARADHVDATLQLLLSGHFLGYLPMHHAAPWESEGRLWEVGNEALRYALPFFAITRSGESESPLVQAFHHQLVTAHA